MTYKKAESSNNDVSVLLCSYNGEEYIEEQLESLRKQTKAVDELYIIDDCSTDHTVKSVESYIKNNELPENWKLVIHEKNLGWKKSFIDGIDLCKNKYLFFCDQDDIWNLDKIEKMVEIFQKNKDVKVLGSSTVELFNDGKTYIKGQNDQKLRKIDYSNDLKGFLEHPPGCAMAVETEYAKSLMYRYKEPWAHDDFFWRYGAIEGSSYMYDSPMICHRVSGKNVTGKKMRTATRRAEQAEYYASCYEDLQDYCASLPEKNEGTERTISYHVKGNLKRKSFLQHPNISDLISLFLKYRYIYINPKQFLGDVVISLKDMK